MKTKDQQATRFSATISAQSLQIGCHLLLEKNHANDIFFLGCRAYAATQHNILGQYNLCQ
jgi:hypothetical protein